MRLWKRILLRSWVEASMPYRALANGIAARQGGSPVVILYYHRIADHSMTPWTMSCSVFAKQMDWLQRRFEMVSLEEAQSRIQSKGQRRPAACITFDDGYADNCDFALPLLIGRQIPCTYFVSTGHVVRGEPFAHDLSLKMPAPPNTIQQLQNLSRDGIEIGGHTRSHADLGATSDSDQLYDEVVAASDELASLIERPIRYFAFPIGLHANLNAEAFLLAKRHGFQGVCSAYGGYNFPGDDSFHLQRIHADPEFARFKNWLTINPHKLNLRRFDYQSLTRGVRCEA